MRQGSIVVPAKGGTVNYVNEDGECRSLELPPGIYGLRPLLANARRGELLDVGKLVIVKSEPRVITFRHPGHFESAANPHFRVSAADRMAKQLRRQLQRTEALARKTAKAMQALRRAKTEPVPDPVGAMTRDTKPQAATVENTVSAT